MSHARKHLQDEMDEDVEVGEGQEIVRMTEPRGTNIVEVEGAPGGERTLCMIPRRFNKLVWVKRGDMLVVERIAEDARPDKVRAILVRPVFPKQQRRLRKLNRWPAVWMGAQEPKPEPSSAAVSEDEGSDGYSSDDSLEALPQNANRRHHVVVDDDTSSDEESGL